MIYRSALWHHDQSRTLLRNYFPLYCLYTLSQKCWTISTPVNKCNCENQIGMEMLCSYYFFSLVSKFLFSGVEMFCFYYRIGTKTKNCHRRGLQDKCLSPSTNTQPSPAWTKTFQTVVEIFRLWCGNFSSVVWKFFVSGVEICCFHFYPTILLEQKMSTPEMKVFHNKTEK